MIARIATKQLISLASQFKSLAIVGPRQSGKTTLARDVFKSKPYVSLENPDTRHFAIDDPRGFLGQFPNGAVLDEIQRTPEIFSYLQQILDDNKTTGQFILTGSNNFLLQENISQSLAGRIAYIILLPLSKQEISGTEQEPLEINEALFRGGYPALYDHPVEPIKWYPNYISTYIERDVRQLKNISNLGAFERVVRLCAGRIGQLMNMHSLSIEAGVDHKTISSWLSVLESSFIIHLLRPHHQNFNKRVVKTPKLYFYDTGLACSLLGIQKSNQLNSHPLKGNLFENFVISELIKNRFNNNESNNLYFWRDNSGNEVDIIIDDGSRLYPIEIKSGKTITADYFKGIKFWNKLTRKEEGTIIYAGNELQKRSGGFKIIPWDKPDSWLND